MQEPTIDMGRKVGSAVPHSVMGSMDPIKHNVAWAEAYLRTTWYPDPCNRLSTIHQRHRQTGQDRQRSDSIGRTVLQTVAPKAETRIQLAFVLEGQRNKNRKTIIRPIRRASAGK